MIQRSSGIVDAFLGSEALGPAQRVNKRSEDSRGHTRDQVSKLFLKLVTGSNKKSYANDLADALIRAFERIEEKINALKPLQRDRFTIDPKQLERAGLD